MTDAEIIKALGGARAVALAVGARRSQASNWPQRGIPAAHRPGVLALARVAGLDLDADAFLRVPEHLRVKPGAAAPLFAETAA